VASTDHRRCEECLESVREGTVTLFSGLPSEAWTRRGSAGGQRGSGGHHRPPAPGSVVSGTVLATGTAPLSYQWFKDGTLVGGAAARVVVDVADVGVEVAGDPGRHVADVLVAAVAGDGDADDFVGTVLHSEP